MTFRFKHDPVSSHAAYCHRQAVFENGQNAWAMGMAMAVVDIHSSAISINIGSLEWDPLRSPIHDNKTASQIWTDGDLKATKTRPTKNAEHNKMSRVKSHKKHIHTHTHTPGQARNQKRARSLASLSARTRQRRSGGAHQWPGTTVCGCATLCG